MKHKGIICPHAPKVLAGTRLLPIPYIGAVGRWFT